MRRAVARVMRGLSAIDCGVTVLGGADDERDWSQRYKANLEKLASGDLVQVVR
jgi:RNA polymerase-interacting CarD/CdnL/TRCF family regulator